MSEESERMLELLQEVAGLKESDESNQADAVIHRKRRKQIGEEMKQLARSKKKQKQ
jgi:hypothetical protein